MAYVTRWRMLLTCARLAKTRKPVPMDFQSLGCESANALGTGRSG